MERKVLDTNILVAYEPEIILGALTEETELLIPYIVVRELDRLKTAEGFRGMGARRALRWLTTLSELGNLREGIEQGHVLIQVIGVEDLRADVADQRIVKDALDTGSSVVSEDLGVHLLASLNGAPVERLGVDHKKREMYTGIGRIAITGDQANLLYQKQRGKTKGPNGFPYPEGLPNQVFQMKDEMGGEHWGACRVFDGEKYIQSLPTCVEAWGVRPYKKDEQRDPEQTAAMQLLMDPSVPFVILTGGAGAGKTYLTLACALEQTLGKSNFGYEKILLMRSMVDMDRDIGFLPGTEEEKTLPWLGGAQDNFEQLLADYCPKDLNYKDLMKDQAQTNGKQMVGQSGLDRMMLLIGAGMIEAKAMNFARGRSIQNRFIIVDDAQNLTEKQVVNLLTRAARGSKFVFLGDLDPKQNDRGTTKSGLDYVVERMAGKSHLVGYINMSNCVRSPLCELALELL